MCLINRTKIIAHLLGRLLKSKRFVQQSVILLIPIVSCRLNFLLLYPALCRRFNTVNRFNGQKAFLNA